MKTILAGVLVPAGLLLAANYKYHKDEVDVIICVLRRTA